MVFFFPGPLVCVLAGATGMSIPLFAICNVVGTFAAVVGYYYLAETIKGPLERTILQGEAVGRPCALGLRIDSEQRIFVSGRVIELGRGEIQL